MSRIQILSIGVDPVTMDQAVQRCLGFMEEDRPHLVVTPNAEFAWLAAHEPDVAAIANRADLAIPDGAGVVLAAKILGTPVPEKVAGVDLTLNLLKALSDRKRGSVYLLGARPEVVAEAARRIQERFPGVTVAGYHDGYWTPQEEPQIIQAIAAAAPDLLLVALGVPKQERWLAAHIHRLQARVCIGVGGTIDVIAGAAARAPEWMIKANLEWAFRIVKFGRYSRSLPPLVKFMLAVLGRRLRG